MVFKNLALALALASAVSAAPALKARDDDCQQTYKNCVAAGTPEVVCSCDLTTCLGEDAARIRDWCYSATASLKTASATSASASATASPTFSSISGIPGGCNPAHPGSCPSSYFTHTTATATVSATASSTFTPIPGIPGGCNPAHPGSCPSSYFTYPTLSATASPAPEATAPAAAAPAPAYPSPVPVEGTTWTVANLTRYCGEGNKGCDYNFAIVTPEGTERCTVIRMPGADAATESWSDQPCTSGSKFKVSWGYVTEPAPPFAVMTVVDGKELAWFGVANVNEQPVTPSNPFGSGQYGSIGPQQVYTY